MKIVLKQQILRAFMLTVVLNILCLPTASADFGWEQVVGDGAGSGNGFGDPDNDNAKSMANFGGYLYVGTNNGNDGCEVWRSSDGTTWNQINTDGFGDTDNWRAPSMIAFGGYLYVGTYNENDGCEVWRSSDGTNWEQVVGDEDGDIGNGFGDTLNYYARSMAILGSYLYVGTSNWTDGCEVWRSSDGTTWNQVNTDGFGDADNDGADSMGVFGSYLYVGTWNLTDGCEVWRSSDGTTWNQVNANGFGDLDNDGAWSMAVFGSYLYVGTYNLTDGCEVWRSSDGTTWNQINTDGFGDTDNLAVNSMANFGSYLYIGTSNDTDGCEVWRSSNGTIWNQVNTDGFEDADNDAAPSMVTFDSYLYLGTWNLTNACEVWRLPQDSDDDGIKDDEDKCPCHPNGINKGTCVMDVGNVVMGYEEGDELITCDDDIDCTPTGGYCQKVQGDFNWNGIGNVCERYADFDDSDDVNLDDLIDLILCYGKTNFETFPLCEQYDINDDNRVSAWDFLIVILEYGMDGFGTCGVGIAPARVAKTGQNSCYDELGVEINCLDTGQDGEYQKGVIGPSPRFTDHGDGTVTDNVTGLMWTKDAEEIPGTMTWSTALTECNDLEHATYTDWRLPNVREQWSLMDASNYPSKLPSGHPFLNVVGFAYWTSTTVGWNSHRAFNVGGPPINTRDKIADPQYTWCVRGETNGPAPVPKTGQTTCYEYVDPDWIEGDCEGTGQDGDHQRGAAWPNPRFTDNADGTITDNLTGLIWLKDANCIATNYPGFDNDETAGDGRVTWQHALDFVAGINGGTYPNCGLGSTDWRLPNTRELQSLIHYGFFNPAIPNTAGTGQWSEGDPFTNQETITTYSWSSFTNPGNTDRAYYVYLFSGSVTATAKSTVYPLMIAVRGGQ